MINLKYQHLILVFLLIANSGMPFFTNEPYILLISLFFTFLFIKPSILNNKLFLATMSFLVISVIGQAVTTNVFTLRTTITLFIRWMYPFVVLLAIRDQFAEAYVKIMYFLTIVALALFVPSTISSGFESYLFNISKYFEQTPKEDFYGYVQNILIYSINPEAVFKEYVLFKRNSGPFWEPGAFGAYLIVAIVFSLLLDNKLLSKRNVTFITALITTWATAPFIALCLVLFLHGFWMYKERLYGLLLIPVVVFGAFYAYTELPFLAQRIDRSIQYYQNRSFIEFERRDRMVSAVVDIRTFMDYPIFGTGRDPQARFGRYSVRTYMEHRNNGVTDFLVKYGLLFFLYYFWMIYKSYYHLAAVRGVAHAGKYGMLAMVGILTVGFSQTLFQQSVFIALYYYSSFLNENTILHDRKKVSNTA